MSRFLILVASVVCALSADLRAQDGVFLGGQIKVGVNSLRYSGGQVDGQPVANPSTKLGMSDNASWIYVRGEESLGAQTAVFFHLEYGLLVTTGEMGTPLSAPRFQAVGVKNPAWGRFLVGRWPTYYSADAPLSHNAIYDAGPYASGTLNVLGSIGRNLRYFAGGMLSNTVRYDSPRWLNTGFNASYSFDAQSPDRPGNHTLNFNPSYNDGQLILYWNTLYRAKQPGGPEQAGLSYDQHAHRLGAAYQFDNGLKLAVLWDRNQVEGSAVTEQSLRRDAWAIPVIYRQGLHLWHVTYGEARPFQAQGQKVADTGARMFSVGYEYALSKRSSVAMSYSTVSNQARAAYDFWYPTNTLPLPSGMAGYRSQFIYAGIKHTF